jgi:hypothetical protein
MAAPHETDVVLVPVPLLKRLILCSEAASETLLSDYANQTGASSAHEAAEEGCRVILDQGYKLDG